MNRPDGNFQTGNNPLGESVLRQAQQYDIPLAGDLDLIAALSSLTPPNQWPEELDAVISTLFSHAQAVRDEVNGDT